MTAARPLPRNPADEPKALPPPSEKRLWFGILAAPAAWTLHEVVGYAAVGQGCRVGGGELPGWAWATVVGISLVSIGLAVAGGLVAYGVFRRSTGPIPVWRSEGWGRVEFMAAFGTLLSALLLVNILMFSVMPLFVEPCVMTT